MIEEEFKFKEVFMSGDIISNPIVRTLDFLRSQPVARIQVLSRTNLEVFSHIEVREKCQKEKRKLSKKLDGLSKKPLYEMGDSTKEAGETVVAENKNLSNQKIEILEEIEELDAQIAYLNENIKLFVNSDKTYHDCIWAYEDYIEENFEEFCDIVLQEKKDYTERAEKINVVEAYFSKLNGSGR